MLYAGFGMVALVLFGGAWWIARLRNSIRRNDGATHGGGVDYIATGAWHHNSTDIAGDV
jgi:hypothetical protein